MNCRTSATRPTQPRAQRRSPFPHQKETQWITASPPRRTAARPRAPRRPPRKRQGIAARRSPPARSPTIPTRRRQVSAQIHRAVPVAAFSCSAVRGFRRNVELPSVRPVRAHGSCCSPARPPAPHRASVPEPSCLQGEAGAATCRFLAGTAIPVPGHGMCEEGPRVSF
ncbi:hypothetical protein GQ55_1G348900 [Panicum hallii var. hallii]|uniref:Uncharacterized protein n=1 Tax=Panicum hallii var. hallii TaxID=1504633 RepID=A0A2T7FAR4_9POAL|nr:hypothetical protein GQ55_1G348900 [Panicum hallii var. hallii]